MAVQWYPGHMAKAKREVTEKLKQIDVVIEIVDARIPLSSRNPMIEELISHKPRLVLLNKSDLADPETTKAWQEAFSDEFTSTLTIDAQHGKGIKQIPQEVKKLASVLFAKWERKGINPRAVRTLILGIPNVGKSTVINKLAGKKIAIIGDKPGVTKKQQWIKVGKEMELLDTPGILWPKFEEEAVGYRLALTGAVKEDLLDFQDMAVFLLRFMTDTYPEVLKSRYDLSHIPEDMVELFDAIGRRRGCLVSGGEVDYDRTAEIVFRDFRQGLFGRVSLEHPGDKQI
ncbi:ribosome biogenesis GTPase YlqF [Alkalicoccus urumqiensis]|uniref:Ribosome biogenesis GTPase A n=1 Tax=Alkalicoccus urumqiensis TaxID=1548213 RepID=A0A2P6MG54_ALKUR|nr:ribosome biogenesis GTPase YlqF [Alkalicoccus urumqiensis]PRO65247.1 ribosome biogenesis GTPase YlqF [Alkalicoccus urumqiensis]